MKKLLCLLLAVTMLLGSMFVLSACDEKDKKKDETEETKAEAPSVPTGYALYENDYVYFVYPEGWEKKDMSGIGVLVDSSTGNNITVAYEIKSDVYATMDLEGYNSLLKPAFQSQGMSVSNIKISQLKNAAGINVTKIEHTAVQSGNTMNQVLFVIPTGEYNYVVTVTQGKGKEISGLVDTVFESLTAKK